MADDTDHNVHIIPHEGQWTVSLAGGEQLSVHDEKEEAVEAGREVAREQQVELVVHDEGEPVREDDSGEVPRSTA